MLPKVFIALANLFNRIGAFFATRNRNNYIYTQSDLDDMGDESQAHPDGHEVCLEGAVPTAQIIEWPERKKKEWRRREISLGLWGSFSDILDCLDGYFDTMRIFKSRDPETYALYEKIGGSVISEKAFWVNDTELTPAWRAGSRPSFAFVHFPFVNEDRRKQSADGIPLRAVYFTKIKKPWDVQRTNGDSYQVTIFYNGSGRYSNRTLLVTFYLAVDGDGGLRLLKSKAPRMKVMPKSGGSFYVQEWAVPQCLTALAAEQKVTVDEYAKRVMCILVHASEASNSGLLVRVKKKGITAAFGIDMLSTPQFFRNRDKTVTVNGKRKKIFHIVRTHKRKMADGTTKNINTHFRGERFFHWFGYSVSVTMPGLHHKDVASFQAGALHLSPEEYAASTERLVTMGEVGSTMAAMMESRGNNR
jgi:hypothetical protein